MNPTALEPCQEQIQPPAAKKPTNKRPKRARKVKKAKKVVKAERTGKTENTKKSKKQKDAFSKFFLLLPEELKAQIIEYANDDITALPKGTFVLTLNFEDDGEAQNFVSESLRRLDKKPHTWGYNPLMLVSHYFHAEETWLLKRKYPMGQ